MVYATLPGPTPPRLRHRATLRALTRVGATVFLSLLLVLMRFVLAWPAVSPVQAASGNAITWQPPRSGPVGTLASITGIAETLPIGSVFALVLRPGAGQIESEYAAICTSSTLAKVPIGQVTTSVNYTFAKTFMWPSAAGQLGPWSVCSYQTSGQMATVVQYFDFTVTASPTPTPSPTPRPPTPTPKPAPKPTPTLTPTVVATSTPTATVLSAPTATLPPAGPANPAPPGSPPSGPSLGVLAIVTMLGITVLGAGSWGILAFRRRQRPGAVPPPAA